MCEHESGSWLHRRRYGWQRALIPIVGLALILAIGIGIPELLKALAS